MPSRPRIPTPKRLSARLAVIDADLVGRVSRGEQPAFDSVYDTLFPMVWSLALRHVGPVQADAEDLTQQILQRVVRSLPQYSPEQPFAHWIGGQVAAELHAFERAAKRRAASASRRATSQPPT